MRTRTHYYLLSSPEWIFFIIIGQVFELLSRLFGEEWLCFTCESWCTSPPTP